MVNLGDIKSQVVAQCSPQTIWLFGSQAKGTAKANSDIDLCIIAEAPNKRQLLTDLYHDVLSDIPIDFILYTPIEWQEAVADPQSFAYKICQEGVRLYG
jgi:predicted nucleotidyltransferase